MKGPCMRHCCDWLVFWRGQILWRILIQFWLANQARQIWHQTQRHFYMYLLSVLPSDLGPKYLYKNVLFCICVLGCVFGVENRPLGFGYQILKGKSLPKDLRDFPWYFGNKALIPNQIKTLMQIQRDLVAKSWSKSLCICFRILIGFQMQALFPKYHEKSFSPLKEDLALGISGSNPNSRFSAPNLQAKIHMQKQYIFVQVFRS